MNRPNQNQKATKTFTVEINGTACSAVTGETVFNVAKRNGIDIPVLCHDDRLAPAGACRVCLVEVEGQRRLQPGCAWVVTPDMKVTTESDRIEKHRTVLYNLYMADHELDAEGLPVQTANNNQLRELCKTVKPMNLEPVRAPRDARPADDNPYIEFLPDLCILCARCTRYCDEVEAVNAITLANRGAETTIATAGQRSLIETSCELCGGCIDTCPTGALVEKKSPRLVKITSPEPGETLNDGNLCVKGRFAFDFVHHEDRITEPLIRGADGQLHPASWDEAIAVAAEGLLSVKAKHGADALGFISSSRCTGEENYLMQKVSRAAFGTNNIHQCAAT